MMSKNGYALLLELKKLCWKLIEDKAFHFDIISFPSLFAIDKRLV